MKILNFTVSQREKRIGIKTNEGNMVLEKFGNELICTNPLRNLKKSSLKYLTLKKVILNSEYYLRDNEIASGIQIFEIRGHLKPFIGTELPTI